MFAVSCLAQFLGPIDANFFFVYGYSIKKYIYHSIIWRWAVLCKKQDGGWIKICEIFSGKSLKEDLSIDTTFDPWYFLWDSSFKRWWLGNFFLPNKLGIYNGVPKVTARGLLWPLEFSQHGTVAVSGLSPQSRWCWATQSLPLWVLLWPKQNEFYEIACVLLDGLHI